MSLFQYNLFTIPESFEPDPHASLSTSNSILPFVLFMSCKYVCRWQYVNTSSIKTLNAPTD